MKKVVAFFILFAIFVSPLFAYIDPGTGSMLFSALAGIVTVLFFSLKNLFIKIKYSGFGIKGKSGISSEEKLSIVIFSEGNQYWNVFKPVVEELEKRKVKCTFYTCDKTDPVFNDKRESVKAEYIGSSYLAYAFMNKLKADVCLMTTPGLDVYQLKRSTQVKHYSFMIHAMTDATLHRLFGLDYFDSILLGGEFQVEHLRALEKIRRQKVKEIEIVGCTYLDVLAEKVDVIKKNIEEETVDDDQKSRKNKTVLVSPSWGASGILIKSGLNFLLPLAESGYNVIIRPHPQSLKSEKKIVETLQEKLSGYKNVEWDFEVENLKSMFKSDIMISDYSGIVFDYLFLFGKPVVYNKINFDPRPYDASDIDEELWIFKMLENIGYELTDNNFIKIGNFIDSILEKNSGREEQLSSLKEVWEYQGCAGVKTADFLERTVKKLNS